MALIVETGAGLINADAYISVADADIYHDNYGNTGWATLDDDVKAQCIRKATQYMINMYRMRWLGRRVQVTQALDWPRVGVVIKDFGGTQGRTGFGSYGLFQIAFTIVPQDIKNACAEFALRASIGPLADDLSQRVISETVGPVSVTYDVNSPQFTRYRNIEGMLKVYLAPNSSMVKLVRT